MHLNDLLDTILVTRKDESFPASSSTSAHSGGKASQPERQATSAMADNASSPGAADACPVDHKTRELWLQQARASGATATNPHEGLPPLPKPAVAQAQQPSPAGSSSWSPWSWFSSPAPPAATSRSQAQQQPEPQPHPPTGPESTLATTRTISSIPRAAVPGPAACPAPAPAATPSSSTSSTRPLNHEIESGADKSTGNWIYPSEKMFFDAMRRKGFSSTQVSDMKTVVPIHNAVNERAWAEIKAWEAPYSGECADGPRLYSFAGVKEKMTPRARVKTLLGYTPPFDRHDWIVDRCGKRVEYVIDFYAGRADGAGQGKVNFYLDVRPKVNSWEGVKMRVLRGVGLA